MPTLRKRNLKNGSFTYFIDFYHNGKRHRKSTGTADKKLATKILKKIEGELVTNKFELSQSGKQISLKDYSALYLEYSKANKAYNTYISDEISLRRFSDFIGDKSLDSIRNQDIENYKISRLDIISKSSVNIELKCLKAAFRRAVMLKFIKENPLKDIKGFKIDKKFPVFLTTKEIEILLQVIDDKEHRAFIQFLLYTGCSLGEGLNIEWKDIDMQRRRINIFAGKTKKTRIIPINDKLFEILNEYKLEKSEGKLFRILYPMSFHLIFKIYLKSAGIEKKVSAHTLRHTFASHLAMSGISLYVIKELLGHSSIKTTEIYSHLTKDYLHESIPKLAF